MPTSHTVHLIDASPYLFRAFFAVPASIVDPGGKPVNMVRGFADFLLRYLKEERPTHIGVAFDQSLTTSFRNEIYPEYKAQRELPPPELEAQQRDCVELARALGMVTWVDARYEADDLIAAACKQVLSGGHRVVVVTSDKDLCQLVGPRATLLDFAKGVRYGPDEVVEKMGVRPDQVADFLGLAGDSVDNIPGVPGIGAKTATALLAAFSGMDELYENLERVPELPLRGARSVAARLAEHRELAFLSRELATVSTDAPAPARLRELEWRGARRELADPLVARLGLESTAARIPRWRE